MPGTLLLDDWQKSVTERLQQHARDAFQAVQPVQPVAPVAAPVQKFAGPNPQIDPNEIIQRLQQHGQSAWQSLQPPPLPQVDPNEVTQRLSQFGRDQLQAVDQNVQGIGQGLQTAVQPVVQQAQETVQAAAQGVQQAVQPAAQALVDRGGELHAYARQAAQHAGIDPDIFERQIQQESGFRVDAKSPAGATGIAQFMPGTAAGMGVDPSDPYASLEGAARLMANHLKQYGGDYAKALAAYNAGPGNVEKYGGVPPFEETQRYVKTILGDAKRATTEVLGGARQAVQNILPSTSQFGDKQLSNAEAYAACGPAAAVRFAQMTGRNPTLREATDLASTVGWTPGSGMAGLQSESRLFGLMQIPHRVLGADWGAFAREAQSGNPVTLSTPGHYFTADAYDPRSKAFHVGQSGLDLRGGSEWMTAAQMEQRMGGLQGGLVADNPQTPSASPLSAPPTGGLGGSPDRRDRREREELQQGARAVGSGLQSLDSTIRDISGTVQQAAADVTAPVRRGVDEALTGIQAPTEGEFLAKFGAPGVALGTAASALGTGASQLATGVRNITPTSELARGVLGQEQLVTENRALFDQQQRLVDEFAAAQERGDQAAMADIQQRMDELQAQLPDARNRDVLLQTAERNPSLGLVETGANLAGAAFATPLAAEGAPLAARALATAIDPATGLPALAGRGLERAGQLRQRGEVTVDAALGGVPGAIERARGGFAAPETVPSTRMFHGTSAEFDRPTAGRFAEDGLFGPGYYLTDEPRVAGGVVARGGEPIPGAPRVFSSVSQRGPNGELLPINPQVREAGDVVQEGYAQERMVSDVVRAQLERQIRFDTEDLARTRERGGGFGVDERIAHLEDNIAYNQARLDRATGGPNVRAVDVPQDLRLLDADNYVDPESLDAIRNVLPQADDRLWVFDREVKRAFESRPTGEQVFNALTAAYGRGPGAKTAANRVLVEAGFDGIRYAGGKRIPMTDEAGRVLEHTAQVIFPESLDKVRNAISGRQGGQASLPFALHTGGAVAGGYAGYQSTPEDALTIPTPLGDFPIERIARTAAGAGAGTATTSATRFRGPLEQSVLESLRQSGVVAGPARPRQPLRGVIPETVDATKQFMLSGLPTHVANVIGGLIELGRQPVSLAVGGRSDDALAATIAAARAIPHAAGNAVSALAKGQQRASLSEGASDIPRRAPIFRALSAADAFIRTLGEYQGMAAEGNRLLREAGMKPSDPGAAAFLASHATDLHRAGTREGARSVFGQAGTTATASAGLENVFRRISTYKEGLLNSSSRRDQAMGALLDLELPFSGVPVRLLGLVGARTPGGTQVRGAVRAAQAIARGDAAEAQRLGGETVLESTIQLLIAKNIADGNIRGPDDPEHPSSINIPGLGWVSMSEMGGYALPMQIMAAFAEGNEKGGHDVPAGTDYVGYYGPRFNAALNASMKPLLKAIPGMNMIKMLGMAAQGNVTGAGLSVAQDAISRVSAPGAARFLENMTDPVARDVQRQGVQSLWEGTMAAWPGLAQYLPEKIDPTTGEPLERSKSGIGTLVGVQQDVASPITIEANRLKQAGFAITPPKDYPDSITVAGAEIKLSPAEQRQVTMITGKQLGSLAERLERPDYRDAPEPRQAQMMQVYLNAVEKARLAAVRDVLGVDELRRRATVAQRTVGRLNNQATAPPPVDFSFLSSSNLSADDQRAVGAGR